jgi:hypothetical protein
LVAGGIAFLIGASAVFFVQIIRQKMLVSCAYEFCCFGQTTGESNSSNTAPLSAKLAVLTDDTSK